MQTGITGAATTLCSVLNDNAVFLLGFGGTGYLVRTPAELQASLKQALDDPMPSIINVLIDPGARGKPQKFAWLTQ